MWPVLGPDLLVDYQSCHLKTSWEVAASSLLVNKWPPTRSASSCLYYCSIMLFHLFCKLNEIVCHIYISWHLTEALQRGRGLHVVQIPVSSRVISLDDNSPSLPEVPMVFILMWPFCFGEWNDSLLVSDLKFTAGKVRGWKAHTLEFNRS